MNQNQNQLRRKRETPLANIFQQTLENIAIKIYPQEISLEIYDFSIRPVSSFRSVESSITDRTGYTNKTHLQAQLKFNTLLYQQDEITKKLVCKENKKLHIDKFKVKLQIKKFNDPVWDTLDNNINIENLPSNKYISSIKDDVLDEGQTDCDSNKFEYFYYINQFVKIDQEYNKDSKQSNDHYCGLIQYKLKLISDQDAGKIENVKHYKILSSFRFCEDPKQGDYSLIVANKNLDHELSKSLSSNLVLDRGAEAYFCLPEAFYNKEGVSNYYGIEIYLNLNLNIICNVLNCETMVENSHQEESRAFAIQVGITYNNAKYRELIRNKYGSDFLVFYQEIIDTDDEDFEQGKFKNDINGRIKSIQINSKFNLIEDFNTDFNSGLICQNFVEFSDFVEDLNKLSRLEIRVINLRQELELKTTSVIKGKRVNHCNYDSIKYDSYSMEITGLKKSDSFDDLVLPACKSHPKDVIENRSFEIASTVNSIDLGYNLNSMLVIASVGNARLPWELKFKLLLENIYKYEKLDFRYDFIIYGKYMNQLQTTGNTLMDYITKSSQVKKDVQISSFSSDQTYLNLESIDQDGLQINKDLHFKNHSISKYWTSANSICVKINVLVPNNNKITESIDHNNLICQDLSISYIGDSVLSYAERISMEIFPENSEYLILNLINFYLENTGIKTIDLKTKWAGQLLITGFVQKPDCLESQKVKLGWSDVNINNRLFWHQAEAFAIPSYRILVHKDILVSKNIGESL